MKSLLIIFITMTLSRLAVAAEKPTCVVASVSQVVVARPPLESVTISLHIHSPVELCGATIVLISDTRDRGKIRAQLPLGRLLVVPLPESVLPKIRKQREAQEVIEKKIDQDAIPTDFIRSAVYLTSVPMADLPAPIEEYRITL